MKIKKMLLADLTPAEYNPRKALRPGDAEYEKLKRSINQFDLVEPLIYNEATSRLVGGHQRLTVLRDMGVTEVECVIVSLTREQEMALNVALNKISGEWDEAKLQALFQDLELAGFDTSVTGFEDVEIEGLFKDSLREAMQQDKFDTVAAAQEPPIAQAGDLWFLGEHRLYCGLLLSGAEVLMNGDTANLVVTDVSRVNAGPVLFKALAENMSQDSSIYVFYDERSSLEVRTAFRDAGFHQSGCCVWRCDGRKGSASPYLADHVPCLYGWKTGGGHSWYADRKQTTVWEMYGDAENKNELPVQVVGYPIVNSSMRNCIVLDPCLGAGAVLVACEQLQRVCYAAEADLALASAAIKRYIDLVGSGDAVRLLRGGLEYKWEEVPK